MNSPREFIEEFAAKQYGKDFPCPRCGRQSMNINPSKNALSRRAGVQICDECGMLEALEDMPGGIKLPLSAWAITKNPVEWEMPLQLTSVCRDRRRRPVYECGGRLYVDVDPRADRHPAICTKQDNDFDGEPCDPELRNKYGAEAPVITLIGSIRDKARLDEVFETYHPSVVFHAAAHKHVPLMEISPAEAVKNNVFGTKNLLTSAAEHGVERFVQLSTDKAVNPTNVMGCTKRLCEMLIQSFASGTDMKCVAVRFGNVLGSHGSVIPLFEEQIKRGGPVTITHPDIVRYFMTITEAAQLVLQAGGLAKGGSIYVLDMGEPVKIMDLATRLIRFYGYEPGVNMQVKITGLRPGEKLYEELLMDAEQDKMLKTAHNKIFIAPPMDIDLEKFYTQLQELKVSAHHNDDAVVECLQEMVPSYHPNRRVRADHTVVAASGNTMILSREELDKARKLHGAKGE